MSTPPFVELPPGVTDACWTIRGSRRAVLHAGLAGASDWVLLVPGFTGSKEDFIAVLPLLAEAGMGAVAFDQLGQCDSDHATSADQYALADLAADIGAVTDAARAAGAPGSPHLLGHSFGGLVVQQAIGDRVVDVRSVTLLGTGPGALPEARHADLAALRAALATTDLAAIWPHLPAARQPMAAPVAEFLRRRWLANDPEQLRAAAHILITQPDLTVRTRAGLTQRPVLVAWGEDDDSWPIAMQRELADELGATAVELPGAGHSPNVDDPTGLVAALLRFWHAAPTAETP